MSEEVLVKVDGLGKKFCKDLKKSLMYGVQDVTRSLLGKPSKKELRKGEFWALKDISFELKRGQCLGLLGHNGAGKSTLLKVLNGLIKPDVGTVRIKGRVGALIELGAGFNPVLTGRENIYNNAAVLGFTKAEVDDKLDEIIDFSELREFIDTPVQSYSSGMKVRLGFAVAAQMEPDVLFIDEVLAVGDLKFRMKCYNAIFEIQKKCAIIFVSHSIPQVARVCSQTIFMNRGEILVSNKESMQLAIQHYLDIYNSKSKDVDKQVKLGGEFTNIKFRDNNESEISVKPNEKIDILFDFNISTGHKSIDFLFQIWDQEMKPVMEIVQKGGVEVVENSVYSLELPELNLTNGVYSISATIIAANEGSILCRYAEALILRVVGDHNFSAPTFCEAKVDIHNSPWGEVTKKIENGIKI